MRAARIVGKPDLQNQTDHHWQLAVSISRLETKLLVGRREQ